MSRWFFVFMLCSSAAFAGGDWKPSPEHTWWECWHQPGTQVSCCSEADGHNLSDKEWRVAPDGTHWQVMIENQWWDVPPKSVVTSNECGPEPDLQHRAEAKVWYSFDRAVGGGIASVDILCFRVGTEY